ncbi:MAG: diguanylate cyclase (GGDEF)-like protein [Phenylobacterium sp.]|jgi:diguanylate cyclase (GGDEF)-like protein
MFYRCAISYFLSLSLLLSLAHHSMAAEVSMYDYDVKQWRAQDGLSSQSVRTITQDRMGYIWVGSLFGLNRFDGNKFEVFNTQNNKVLVSNAINKVFIDSTGYLWVGTKSGLSGVDPANLQFSNYFILDEVTDIIETPEKEVLVAAGGLFRLVDKAPSKIKEVLGEVQKIEVSAQGTWVVTDTAIYLIKDGVIVKNISLASKISQSIIHDLFWSETEGLYLATEIGAFRVTSKNKIEREVLPLGQEIPVYKIVKDSGGGMWLSTLGSLFYRKSGQKWQPIVAEQLGHSPWFTDIFEDRDGNIWLASNSDGLWRASVSSISRHQPKNLPSRFISSVTSGPGDKLWVGTQRGVGTLDKEGKFEPVVPPSILHRQNIYGMAFSDDDKVLLATESGLLVYQDGQLTIPRALEPLQWSLIRVIVKRQDDSVWLGTSQGLYQYAKGRLIPYRFNARFDSKNITYVLDQQDSSWVATTRGVYKITGNNIERMGLGTALYRSYVTSILDLGERGVLLGTLDDGLFYRAKEGDEWVQYDESSGLANGVIVALHYQRKVQLDAQLNEQLIEQLTEQQQAQQAQDGLQQEPHSWRQFEQSLQQEPPEPSNVVWVSTLRGVYRFKVIELGSGTGNIQIENILSPFDRQLGATSGRCCNGIGHQKIADYGDSLWFPSSRGVVEVPKDIDLYGESSHQIAPIIQNIVTARRKIVIGKQKDFQLDLNERDFTVFYSTINYKRPQSEQFRYRLEGYDANWNYVDTRREAVFTNLPSGTFTFRVQTRQVNQTWHEAKDASIVLKVPKQFSETMLYRLLVGALIILVLYGVVLLIRNREVRKRETLRELVEQRTVELQSVNAQLNEANQKLKQLSNKDELSGLRNRHFVYEQLPKDIEHYQRNRESMMAQGKSFALVVINIDGFKHINDGHGPIAGDSVLTQFAVLLTRETRGSDYVVRWGGDEFLIVLRDTQANQIESFIYELNLAVANGEFYLPDGQDVNITCSIGYAFYPLPLIGGQLINWEVSLSLADMALHQVQNAGRNGWATVEFDDQVDAFEFEDNDALENSLEQLFETGAAKFNVRLADTNYA